METATEGGADSLGVSLAFTLEFGEAGVCWVAADLGERRVLKVVLSVVYDRHCLVEGPLVVVADNSVISVTTVKRKSLR